MEIAADIRHDVMMDAIAIDTEKRRVEKESRKDSVITDESEAFEALKSWSAS